MQPSACAFSPSSRPVVVRHACPLGFGSWLQMRGGCRPRNQDSRLPSRRNVGRLAPRQGEPQRFSALQQRLVAATLHFIWQHIQTEPRTGPGQKPAISGALQRVQENEVTRLFCETMYYRRSGNETETRGMFAASLNDCSPTQVCNFLLDILHQGILGVSEFIISVMYLSSFKRNTGIALHQFTWRPLVITCLLLADKMWEDKPMRLTDMAKLFPVVNNAELKRLEHHLVETLKFNVVVTTDEFMVFCEFLLSQQVHPDITRNVEQSEYIMSLKQESKVEPEGPHHDLLPIHIDRRAYQDSAWQTVWSEAGGLSTIGSAPANLASKPPVEAAPPVRSPVQQNGRATGARANSADVHAEGGRPGDRHGLTPFMQTKQAAKCTPQHSLRSSKGPCFQSCIPPSVVAAGAALGSPSSVASPPRMLPTRASGPTRTTLPAAPNWTMQRKTLHSGAGISAAHKQQQTLLSQRRDLFAPPMRRNVSSAALRSLAPSPNNNAGQGTQGTSVSGVAAARTQSPAPSPALSASGGNAFEGSRNSSWGRPRGATYGRDPFQSGGEVKSPSLVSSDRTCGTPALAGLSLMGSGRSTLPAGATPALFAHSTNGSILEPPCASREGTGTLAMRENTAPLPHRGTGIADREGTGSLASVGVNSIAGSCNSSPPFGARGGIAAASSRPPSSTREGSRPPLHEAWGRQTCRPTVTSLSHASVLGVSPRGRLGRVHSPIARYTSTAGCVPVQVPPTQAAVHPRLGDRSCSRSPDRASPQQHVSTPPPVPQQQQQQQCRWGTQVTPRVPAVHRTTASPTRAMSPHGSTPQPHTPVGQGGRAALPGHLPVPPYTAGTLPGQQQMLHVPAGPGVAAASAVAARGRGMLQFGWNWWS